MLYGVFDLEQLITDFREDVIPNCLYAELIKGRTG